MIESRPTPATVYDGLQWQRKFMAQVAGKPSDADLSGMVRNNLNSWLGMQESFLNMLASMTSDQDNKRRDR
jgi:hypothetical protein